MSTGDKSTDPSRQQILEEPDPSNNEELLEQRLETLRDRYSYENLSDLSARRLGALDLDEGGLSEEEALYNHFDQLRGRFPDHHEDSMWQNLAIGHEYKALAPLTHEQEQRIRDCEQECSRNLDRARQDALEREDSYGLISRLATWLVEFAEAFTPVFGRWK